jgi:Flp pilus assembly protein TadG
MIINKLKRKFRVLKGQSLIETAIITPILLILFIGVFEVGWVLRSYIVLTNANREATRFGAKGVYLDFTQANAADIGYDSVRDHGVAALSKQLPIDLSPDTANGSMIVSYFKVDTGIPCQELKTGGECRCDGTDTPYQVDDEIILPTFGFDPADFPQGWQARDYLEQTYGLTDSDHQSKFKDWAYLKAFVEELIKENNDFNCQLSQKTSSVPWSVNSVIADEIIFDQDQLMGIPFISNPFTDPVTLYSQTVMRIAPGDNQALGCPVLPIGIHEDTVNQAEGTFFPDIREGDGSGSFGWLTWRNERPPDNKSTDETITANTNSGTYLAEAIRNPMLSVYDFIDADDSEDRMLNEDDWVWSNTGNVASAADDIEAMIPGIYLVPIWDTTTGSGANLKFHITGFAWFKLSSVDMTGNPKEISAMFISMENGACLGNGL